MFSRPPASGNRGKPETVSGTFKVLVPSLWRPSNYYNGKALHICILKKKTLLLCLSSNMIEYHWKIICFCLAQLFREQIVMQYQKHTKRLQRGGLQDYIFSFVTIYLEFFYIVSWKNQILYVEYSFKIFCRPLYYTKWFAGFRTDLFCFHLQNWTVAALLKFYYLERTLIWFVRAQNSCVRLSLICIE